MSKASSQKGRFQGRKRPKPIEPETFSELRAIDPARSFQDWIEWLRIVRPGKQRLKSKLNT